MSIFDTRPVESVLFIISHVFFAAVYISFSYSILYIKEMSLILLIYKKVYFFVRHNLIAFMQK